MMAPMFEHLLRLPPGPVDLTALATDETPGFEGSKSEGKAALAELGDPLSDLQERLFAEGVAKVGHGRAVLLVLQGMDTSGKGGVLRHTVGLVDPQGVRITSFKAPSDEEGKHDFLWRIRKALPAAGHIGVFDRSHYEDVLVTRVEGLVPRKTWEKRYDEINDFEAELVASGTTVLKLGMMVSHDEQGLRLMKRLDRPDKHWKFSKNDVPTRRKWDDYQEAYADVFRRTSTEAAPWYVVPADHKWFTRLVVSDAVIDALNGLKMEFPKLDPQRASELEEARRELEGK